jgi:hypothetical protein
MNQKTERMGKLLKLNGIWKYHPINSTRHLCDVCNHMSYTWKTFNLHKKTHTFAEHDRALWTAVSKDRLIGTEWEMILWHGSNHILLSFRFAYFWNIRNSSN